MDLTRAARQPSRGATAGPPLASGHRYFSLKPGDRTCSWTSVLWNTMQRRQQQRLAELLALAGDDGCLPVLGVSLGGGGINKSDRKLQHDCRVWVELPRHFQASPVIWEGWIDPPVCEVDINYFRSCDPPECGLESASSSSLPRKLRLL